MFLCKKKTKSVCFVVVYLKLTTLETIALFNLNLTKKNFEILIILNHGKCFILLAVLRRSVQQAFGIHLRVIAPISKIPLEMSRRWRAVDNTVSDLTSPRFESRSHLPLQRVTPYRSTNRQVLLTINSNNYLTNYCFNWFFDKTLSFVHCLLF